METKSIRIGRGIDITKYVLSSKVWSNKTVLYLLQDLIHFASGRRPLPYNDLFRNGPLAMNNGPPTALYMAYNLGQYSLILSSI